jgi:hypothetical protein
VARNTRAPLHAGPLFGIGRRTNHRMAAPTTKIAPMIRPFLAVGYSLKKQSGNGARPKPANTAAAARRMARAPVIGASISFWWSDRTLCDAGVRYR